ncbi:retrovirus-related Pol polyprotein from transposon 17.6 [Trichonephila clavata]|uniref:Retrovirus-related Pol polyprotein from transposon 17.6 n=1 Tax=Trichonephila clavata TaxID=2740835 RepID=A0A8X6GSL9_TRICU|nr:retrovirus-related Pol polyprotein from transposon 17.6 [Trichonephila clavata]
MSQETDINKFVEEQLNIQESIDDVILKLKRENEKLSSHSNSDVRTERFSLETVKLPKLTLPTFSGNLHDWITFKDLFKASVHNNSNLSNAQKLQYLKSSLKGDAFRIIQSIAISDSNYLTAWELLEDRYSNKREHVFAHIRRLMSLNTIQCESASAVLSLVDNCRCLLDTGSQRSFISNECAKKLGLTIRDSSATISCLGSFNTVSNGEVDLLFISHFESDLQISTSAFVIEKVTDKIPHVSLPANICYKFNDLRLADPSFHKSANIDILLGVNVFLNLINGEIIKRAPNLPFAMSTKLGWIISGTTNLESPNSNPVVVNHVSVNTDNLVKSFWELESIPNSSPLTREEKQCELRFEEHHTRDNNGRYSAMLTFKPNRKENPADCASRGLLPSELVDHELWWFGPKWLMTSDIPFPTDVSNCQEALKEERKQTSCAVGLSVEELPIISRVSSFRKLQRVLAWCLRFISNAK